MLFDLGNHLRNFLLDINECQDKPCHANAVCTDIVGSYVCQCNQGFTGHGTTCTGEGRKSTCCD